MRTLRQDGWEKVKKGITTPSEVIRVTQEEIAWNNLSTNYIAAISSAYQKVISYLKPFISIGCGVHFYRF